MAKEFISEEGKVSEYNQAALKMIRFHDYFKKIAELRLYPDSYDVETRKFNIQVCIELYKVIWKEIYGKASEQEIKVIDFLFTKIKELMKKYPLYEIRKNNRPYFERDFFPIYEELYDKLEKELRLAFERAGYDSPNIQEDMF